MGQCVYVCARALVCVASPPGKLTTLMNVRKSATSKRKCMSSSARCNVRLSGPESALSSNALNLRLILSIIRPREKSNPWEILIHRAFSFSRKKKEICIDRIPITKEKSWIWASKKEMYNLYIFFFIIHLIYPESFIDEIRRAILVPVNKVLSIVYVDLLARFQPASKMVEANNFGRCCHFS